MRVKAALFVLMLILAATAAYSSDNQPINTTQLAAWLTAGVPGTRLARLVEERGLATLPTSNELHQLEAAGAGKELMKVVSSGSSGRQRSERPSPRPC